MAPPRSQAAPKESIACWRFRVDLCLIEGSRAPGLSAKA